MVYKGHYHLIDKASAASATKYYHKTGKNSRKAAMRRAIAHDKKIRRDARQLEFLLRTGRVKDGQYVDITLKPQEEGRRL